MSASFCTSYAGILSRDIRHTHSGLPVSDLRLKKHIVRGKAISVQEDEPKKDELKPKDSEYIQQYDIAIPKAPAFKQVSRDQVDVIVGRLHNQSVVDKKMKSDQAQKEIDEQMRRERNQEGLLRDSDDVDQISDRLHRHPTHSSNTRVRAAVRTPLRV